MQTKLPEAADAKLDQLLLMRVNSAAESGDRDLLRSLVEALVRAGELPPIAQILEALDDVTAALETCLAHFESEMPVADRWSRNAVAARARQLLKQHYSDDADEPVQPRDLPPRADASPQVGDEVVYAVPKPARSPSRRYLLVARLSSPVPGLFNSTSGEPWFAWQSDTGTLITVSVGRYWVLVKTLSQAALQELDRG